MIRRQISKILTWQKHGHALLYRSIDSGHSEKTSPFTFENGLLHATLTIRARKPGQIGSKENFLSVNMIRKKDETQYDNHNVIILSLPVGHEKENTQTSVTLDSVTAGEEVVIEVCNTGPDPLDRIEIQITQDIEIFDENSFSDFWGLSREENTQFGTFAHKKVYGGDDENVLKEIFPIIFSSIYKDLIDGQEMVWIPRFYFKTVKGIAREGYRNKEGWLISEKAIPGFMIHPAFMHQGKEIEGFWIGAYEASKDGEKACSLKDVDPWRVSSFDEAKQACESRNIDGVNGFHMLTIYELAAIQILIFLDIADPDVQKKIGKGYTSISKTGASDALWRGISEFWGNTYCLLDGIKTVTTGDDRTLYLYDLHGNKEFIDTKTPPSSPGGTIYRMKENFGKGFDFRTLFIPNVALSSSAVKYSFGNDQYHCPAFKQHKYWAHGRSASSSLEFIGLFSLSGNLQNAWYSKSIGFRLAKI